MLCRDVVPATSPRMPGTGFECSAMSWQSLDQASSTAARIARERLPHQSTMSGDAHAAETTPNSQWRNSVMAYEMVREDGPPEKFTDVPSL